MPLPLHSFHCQHQQRNKKRKGNRSGNASGAAAKVAHHNPNDSLSTSSNDDSQSSLTSKSTSTNVFDISSFADLLPPPATCKESLPPRVQRYWFRRKNLFSLFDSGIRMDEVGWFSVTPETFGAHLAERCRCDTIVDLFAGVGGNAIQFAYTCEIVYTVELDPVRLACSQHNAQIYDVANRIEFILGDSLTWLERTRLVPDVIFLSPPWGGQSIWTWTSIRPRSTCLWIGSFLSIIQENRLLRACLAKTRNLALYLPKNLGNGTIKQLTDLGLDVEIEEMYAWGGVRAVTLYTGALAKCPSTRTQVQGED
ncbi:RNA cap guanine-N2 methyltransferase-domain-containing protein [Catenaria anguillulae PL171]|uniref:Trimethylguanosine synthase n=1 Tax=Catenaria anguillulae PL171 TaxID=765915 RepID=A0A1Y2I045_9FUNG|nr:RNA cap guanine-N2 methyltransferase-domain-containing protein [Catenaria anguillulae PL171]